MRFRVNPVGKELIAEIIHQTSNRREGPFKGKLWGHTKKLLESELLVMKGLPGLEKWEIGLFELANNGILFLDEIESCLWLAGASAGTAEQGDKQDRRK